MSIRSRLWRGAALLACAITLSLSPLAATAPAHASTGAAAPVPVPGAMKIAPPSTGRAIYTMIPAFDNCPGSPIVKMFNQTDNTMACVYTTGLFQIPPGAVFNILVSFVPNRVWLHQTYPARGWADCFRDPFYPKSGASWTVTGSRDATPGDIQVSSNTAAC